ncbi:MAG: response regulator [Chloroflexi bacterium]|nr:response regulator [Chloroflexota bacterium]
MEPLPIPEPPAATDLRRTILIVEDDDAVSSLLVALLDERGYRTLIARSGRTALRLARQIRPHLITLDLALPGIDGRAVLEQLKSDPATREIPVVVISAYTQILPAGERKKLAYLLGKPFDVTEVLEVIQATVGNPFL